MIPRLNTGLSRFFTLFLHIYNSLGYIKGDDHSIVQELLKSLFTLIIQQSNACILLSFAL